MRKTSPNATRYTAIGLVCFGLILIFFAWNGSAGENGLDLRAQFPYLLSGGLGGLALIATGLTLIRVFEARRDTLMVLDRLDKLTRAVERLDADRVSQELAEANAREMGAADLSAMPPPAPPFEAAQP